MNAAYTRLVRIFAVLTVLLVGSSAAGADHIFGNDAGTGTDAGNTKEAATLLAGFGAYTGYIASKDPSDWYRVDTGGTAPRCVTATFTPENNATMQLTLEGGSKTYQKLQVVPQGKTGELTFAVPSLDRTFFNTSAASNDPGKGDPTRPGHYEFNLSSVSATQVKATSSLTGDDDAGNTLETAAPLSFGCSSGRSDPLTGFGDPADVYKLTLYPGETITYSFAYAAPVGLELRLLDQGGAQIDAIKSGGIGTYTVPMSTTSSSYYLSVVRLDSAADAVTYLIGVDGPPTTGCRPNC